MSKGQFLAPLILLLATMTSAEAKVGSQSCTGEVLPLTTKDQIVAAVTCEMGGKVLRIEPKSDHSGYFEALLLLNGRISTIVVDAETGAIQPNSSIGE